MNEYDLFRRRGDFLEQAVAEKTIKHLPGYVRFWARFIGNDRDSGYLPMKDATPQANALRTELWEHIYTMFESFALCWRIEEEVTRIEEEVFQDCRVPTYEEYTDILNHWMAFHAHLGRIHDMAEKAANPFKKDDLHKPFKEFYAKRHTVLHYPKVPMAFHGSMILGPFLSERPGHWWEKLRWNDADPEKFEFLSKILASTLRELERVANDFLYNMVGLVKSEKGFCPIQWETEAEIVSDYSSYTNPPSGRFNGPTPSGTQIIGSPNPPSSLD